MTVRIPPDVRGLMRPSAAALEPYDPAFSPARINLSANENTYGMPAEVRAKVSEALAAVATNRYPHPLSDELRAELALWHGVTPGQVCVGNGGDELIFNLLLAFGGAGHALVNCPPTFSVYRLYAELLETPVMDVPRDAETFVPDVDGLVEAARTARLVFVTSPNNPTGDLVPAGCIERLCEACPGIVLADEAYIEFAGEGTSVEGLLAAYPNLVVLHTLSKAFCLAGARIGYVLSNPSIIAALQAVRQPYSVNVLSQAAVLTVVRNREAFEPIIGRIVSERGRLSTALAALPDVRVWPSSANFLCVRLSGAHEARARLRDEFSILVRDFSQAPGLADCLRITVGMPQENDAVIDSLSVITGR